MIELSERSYCIHNCTVITPRGPESERTVRVDGGIVCSIETRGNGRAGEGAEKLPAVDGKGLYLCPGFVELHIHGCGETGVEEVLLGKDTVLEQMAARLSRSGINTFLPTFPFHMDVLSGLAAELKAKPFLSRRIPGLYLEGPFVNPEKRGGIPEEFCRAPDVGYLEEILAAGRGTIKMMTLAPELPGSGRIARELIEAGVVPCIGHTEASAARCLEFIRETDVTPDRFNITHLFNAMSPLSHKVPGTAAVPFLDRDIFFELNSDGIHVADEILKICAAYLDRERTLLISDAVISAGESFGEGEYFGRAIRSGNDGVRYTESGVLIGSNRLVPDAARHFMEAAGLEVPDVLPLITANPFQMLGLPERGRIVPGAPADLILVDEALTAQVNLNPFLTNPVV